MKRNYTFGYLKRLFSIKKLKLNNDNYYINNIITMYVYFKLTNSVLTCEEYPQILSVEEMKLHKLENTCNKWEKNVSEDGTFTL